MIPLLLSLALADQPAARTMPGPAAAAVGWHERSVAMRLSDRWRGGLTLAGTGSLELGLTSVKALGEGPWRGELTGGLGLVALLVDPGAGLALTGGLAVGRFGDGGIVAMGVVVPAVVGTARFPVRVPALGEGRLDAKLGPVWVGARFRAGPVWTPLVDVAAYIEPGVQVGLAR